MEEYSQFRIPNILEFHYWFLQFWRKDSTLVDLSSIILLSHKRQQHWFEVVCSERCNKRNWDNQSYPDDSRWIQSKTNKWTQTIQHKCWKEEMPKYWSSCHFKDWNLDLIFEGHDLLGSRIISLGDYGNSLWVLTLQEFKIQHTLSLCPLSQ